jgi:glycosyltransferase involved in cell wall biosynthesis
VRIERKIPEDILPCSSNYQYESQPYYIVAPAFRQQSAGVRLMHELCSTLNQLGYEAYVDTSSVSGNLWTPQLTGGVQAAHCKAGKKPIVVYPEVVKGVPMGLGLPVRYVLNYPGLLGGDKEYTNGEMVYAFHNVYYRDVPRLYLPIVNLTKLSRDRLASHERTEIAYYHNRYTKAGGQLRDFGPDALEISSTFPDTNEKTLDILKRAKILYSYESSGIVLEATLCGCAVVLLPNPICLPEIPESLTEVGDEGVAWGEDPEAVSRALRTVAEKMPRFEREMANWQQELSSFISATQSAAQALPFEKAWPQTMQDRLPFTDLSAKDLAERSSRRKYGRVNEHYQRWMQRCTLREIDADIYAEHLSSGQLPAIAVLIDHRNAHVNALADTLDSLGECLGQPYCLTIVSEQPAPAELANDPHIEWLVSAASTLDKTLPRQATTAWTLLLRSGTRVAPQALVEWALATQQWPEADLVYADDDVWMEDGSRSYPNFKSDANVELLRCTNYLGSAVLVRHSAWEAAGLPIDGPGLYGFALRRMLGRGRSALGHIDTVLSHVSGHLDQAQENQEYLAASGVLVDSGVASGMEPLSRLGTWLVNYPVQTEARVSIVIPTGLQTGYLRSLVESLQRYPQPNLGEIILVCAPDQVAEVEYALSDELPGVPCHVVELEQAEYNHGRALNAGVARASGAFVLVCDDDTEMLHANWLSCLLGLAQQAGVGCVSPRLMANRGPEARVAGGPMVLGINGSAAPYNGEEGRLEEVGVYSRLHLTQDVGTVAGHCFLFARSHWSESGGFDEDALALWFPVLDFCLRLARKGLRHIWTPQSNVLHHGRKTLDSLARDHRSRIRMAEREISEKDELLARWAPELANDGCYNRHLSLYVPFDVEPIVVIDWQPKRRERPRLLAVPMTSGAGQYRVIEPLNALQDASLVQTCVVIPEKRGMTRILQPLELVRAAPDRLILQHSVDDAQLGQTDRYKLAMPGIQIVQMVDDLLGEVPVKHPNRIFQSREGHQRMIQALKQSDILVVTTEPLREHYRKYVKDVRLVPNALGEQWSGLRKAPEPREKLRVGWIGAAQHKGDLDLVTEVVRELATEVDWVFMGMCTDEIRPYIKEFHGFVSISEYPQTMADLNLDIAIAPLEDNIFNTCKSNLRLLEYGAMAWPVVCSDVYPYRSDAPPVLRCSSDTQEWVRALRQLMADPDLRARMGEELHNWVNAKFALSGLVTRWKESLID